MAELNDTYVVHGAAATCTMGMRFSYIALHKTYGVFLRMQPQMTVKDCIGNYNILNFGGCFSMENPDTQNEARKVEAAVEEQCPDTFLDGVMNFFCGGKKKEKKQQEASAEVPQVVGKCMPIILGGQEWDNGKDGVKTCDKTPLLGGAKLHCKYGGEIEIVHSGQQEAGGEG